jgi:hypothetical protein
MADVVFVGVIFGFFALCVAYVLGCDRIIQGGEQDATAGELEPERVVR